MSIRGFLQIWLKIFHLQVTVSQLPPPSLCAARTPSAFPMRRALAYTIAY